MNEASWRAHDLLRAYAARDRAANIEHPAHLEADQLEFTRGVSANFYDDSLSILRDTGRPWVPASPVREVFAVARFAPTEHEFTVTTAACRLARGEVTMRKLIDRGSWRSATASTPWPSTPSPSSWSPSASSGSSRCSTGPRT